MEIAYTTWPTIMPCGSLSKELQRCAWAWMASRDDNPSYSPNWGRGAARPAYQTRPRAREKPDTPKSGRQIGPLLCQDRSARPDHTSSSCYYFNSNAMCIQRPHTLEHLLCRMTSQLCTRHLALTGQLSQVPPLPALHPMRAVRRRLLTKMKKKMLDQRGRW